MRNDGKELVLCSCFFMGDTKNTCENSGENYTQHRVPSSRFIAPGMVQWSPGDIPSTAGTATATSWSSCVSLVTKQ
jgi:predicted metal-dependent enzyme (double-stranded beta helix superfamily)